MRRLAVMAVLVAPILAGCLGDDAAPEGGTPPVPFVDPMRSGDANHSHNDRNHHQLSYYVEQLAHDALTEQDGETAQVHSIDLCGSWVVLGREAPGTYGVDIVDVSNPAQPQWVGQYRDERAVPGDRDVAWSADCEFVFMANQGGDEESAGVRVINARDKARPAYESFYWIPGVVVPGGTVPGVGSLGLTGAVHTVSALKVGATQYVYALNYGVHILKLVPDANGVMVLQLAGRYVAADPNRLQAVNQPDPDLVATRRTLFGHDVTVYEEDGRVLMYVAYAYDGLRIVDVTNPAMPQEVGRWTPSGAGAPHYVHSVKSYWKGDHRVTVVGSETFEDRNTDTPSPIWILDTTDPTYIRQLSRWQNPGAHGADHLLFSAQFFEIENDTLWMAHYHGGVWVLDLKDPTMPRVVGYYLPAADTGFAPREDCCYGWKFGGIPMTFAVALRDGVAYAADFSTGLYILRQSGVPPA